MIGTDCIGSCKSNYHTITATTAPENVLNRSMTINVSLTPSFYLYSSFMFISVGHDVVSTNFDFTLLYKLIRNLLTDIPEPTDKWGNQPLPENLSETDDIERIRHLRNFLAHNSEFEICDADFFTHWNDLSPVK